MAWDSALCRSRVSEQPERTDGNYHGKIQKQESVHSARGGDARRSAGTGHEGLTINPK